MALYSILRRASSSVLPLAIRTVGSSRALHGAASTVRLTLQKGNLSRELTRRSFVPFLRFSTETAAKNRADENLIRVLESELQCAEESEPGQDSVEEIPDEFPFEIEDNLGERTILLTREFEDETIKVEVDIPNVSMEDEGDDDADNQDQSNDQTSIPLVVRITKRRGLELEFGVTAFPDEFTIDSLSIKQPDGSEDQLAYEGPDFNDLDENLQKAFHKYLEVRGIKPSTTNFLHEYMIAKDSKEYMNWLKNLKNFVEH
ncbi:Mitochondrial glycoprotein [Trema orientale]|uniref:Mitochondrial glycoprotein n=1 Tax=Trema orientale TaxID=63057 RepID=A0A2P5EZ37_TREOI|nr:Mitochondrial glycoprotein [Trema orientale]